MLDIATELFALRGYRAVTVREIALRSGVTLSSLYHHFGDKRRLYIQVHLRTFALSSALLEAAVARGSNSRQRLLSFATEYCRILSEPGPMFRLLVRHYVEAESDVVASLAQATVPAQFRRVREAIKDLVPRRDSTAAALSLYALINGRIMLRPFADSLPWRVEAPKTPEAMAVQVLSALIPEIDWRPVRIR